jgi:CRP-like cAMP-binding protein
MASLVQKIDANQQHYIEKMEKVKSYMVHRKIPKELQLRIRRYYKHYFSKVSALDEQTIMNELSTFLRQELALVLIHDTICQIPLFQVLLAEDLAALASLVPVFKPLTSNASDYLIQAGEVSRELFILIEGELEVFDSDGHFVRRVLQGQCVGQRAALNIDRTRRENVIAACKCELYSVNGADMFRALAQFPACLQKMADAERNSHKAADTAEDAVEDGVEEGEAERAALEAAAAAAPGAVGTFGGGRNSAARIVNADTARGVYATPHRIAEFPKKPPAVQFDDVGVGIQAVDYSSDATALLRVASAKAHGIAVNEMTCVGRAEVDRNLGLWRASFAAGTGLHWKVVDLATESTCGFCVLEQIDLHEHRMASIQVCLAPPPVVEEAKEEARGGERRGRGKGGADESGTGSPTLPTLPRFARYKGGARASESGESGTPAMESGKVGERVGKWWAVQGKAIVGAIVDYAVTEPPHGLGLQRVEARIAVAAPHEEYACLRDLGFLEEGCLRRKVRVQSAYYDLRVFGYLPMFVTNIPQHKEISTTPPASRTASARIGDRDRGARGGAKSKRRPTLTNRTFGLSSSIAASKAKLTGGSQPFTKSMLMPEAKEPPGGGGMTW